MSVAVTTNPKVARRLRPKDLRREARGWRWGALAALVLAAAAFAANAVLGELHPGNVWGLTYGTSAAVLLLVAALYGLRRRTMKASTRFGGRSRAWLWLHVWGGGLFLVLVLMHSGFRLPTGALTWWLWGLSGWTVLTGLLGLLLQSWIPRVLSSGLTIEANYERIPELIDEIRGKAEGLVAEADAPIADLYRKSIAPELAAPRRRLIYFTDITGGIHSRLTEMEYLKGFLSAEQKEKLAELERLFRAKLEIDAHYTLQQALRSWLYLHVPLSLVLLGLVVLHVLTVVYY